MGDWKQWLYKETQNCYCKWHVNWYGEKNFNQTGCFFGKQISLSTFRLRSIETNKIVVNSHVERNLAEMVIFDQSQTEEES